MKKMISLLLSLYMSLLLQAQPISFTNCPACTSADIALFDTINTKYLGVSGYNPSTPSTYNLIGDNKFAGSIHDAYGVFLQNNWYPIRTRKQMFSGTIVDFGVANYGDESDWNIHLLPANGFTDFIADALYYKKDNWYAFGPLEDKDEWKLAPNGQYTVEAEITPASAMFNNPWFNNNDSKTYLVNKRIGVYGPFVAEESHGMKPEIHPCEQIWWKETDKRTMILLVGDASNRFDEMSDFEKYSDVEEGYKPWAQDRGQESEMSIPFEIDPARGSLYYSIQALVAHNFYSSANYEDATSGRKHTITYRGQSVLTIEESSEIDTYVGITFRNVCFSAGKLRGYIVLRTAIGNGGGGREGFVALQIDKEEVGINERPGIVTGNIINTNNQWTTYDVYDDAVLFGKNIISSDKEGKGIVDGMIDFNGNGKTDLFTSVNGKWKVLYDARGTWQEINTSGVPQADLRFGDINGDGITDILHVNGERKVEVSYSGTGRWTTLTDAGEQTPMIQVGDFNGDNRTDIVYFKYRGITNPLNWPTQILRRIADMYVKFSCTGSWIELNNGYELKRGEYETNFRFGNFNGDNITDIFRYNDYKFKVYYNGRGYIQELCDPLISSFNLNDLLFVDNLSRPGYTDIIYVKRSTHAWKTYNEGRTTAPGRILKYNDPANVHFGNLNDDQLWEPFTKDFVSIRALPEEVTMKPVTQARIEPMIVYKYEKGSLQRGEKNGRPVLLMNVHALYHPGNGIATRRKDNFRGVTTTRLNSDGSRLDFTSMDNAIDGKDVIGNIKKIPLSSVRENRVDIKFPSIAAADKLEIPAYGISALKGNFKETINGTGRLEAWKNFVFENTNQPLRVMLADAPGSVEKVETISWELLPYYSSIEETKVSSVEVPEVMKELNNIAYGDNAARITGIFGNANVFNIEWKFELKNLTTGTLIPVTNPASVISAGKWEKNKISYTFPAQNDLLQFTAAATIKDPFGNSTVKPVVYVFFNQQVRLTDVKSQVRGWLNGLEPLLGKQYGKMTRRAYRISRDAVINPAEMKGLLK